MKQLCFTLAAVVMLAACQPQEEIAKDDINVDYPTKYSNDTPHVYILNNQSSPTPPIEIEIGEVDAIEAENYILYFSPVEGTEIESLLPVSPIQTFPDTISNWYEYAQLIESTRHQSHSDKFRRSGDILWLLLQNGQKLLLKDSINKAVYDYDDYAYTLYHYFPEQDYYLVRVQFGEGNAFMLINRKNGFKKYILGEPYFSPSGEYVVSLSSDLEAGYNPTVIQLLLNKGDSLSEQMEVHIKNWGPSKLKWMADNEFILQKERIQHDSIDGIKYIPSWSRVIIRAK